jgi:hypothetical protein
LCLDGGEQPVLDDAFGAGQVPVVEPDTMTERFGRSATEPTP